MRDKIDEQGTWAIYAANPGALIGRIIGSETSNQTLGSDGIDRSLPKEYWYGDHPLRFR